MTRTAVIPLAGDSSRFATLTSRPKWALQVGERTILDLAVASVLEESLEVSRFIFVLKRRNLAEFQESLTTLSEGSFEVILVDKTPNGQASSVAIALLEKRVQGEFLVWNGDTHLVPGWGQGCDFAGNGLVLTNLNGDHWSFATIEAGMVSRTAEKSRISPHASVGLYNFASSRDFMDAFSAGDVTSQEVYVAPLYNYLISQGILVRAHLIPKESFFPLGTPAEVLDSAQRLGLRAPIEIVR